MLAAYMVKHPKPVTVADKNWPNSIGLTALAAKLGDETTLPRHHMPKP